MRSLRLIVLATALSLGACATSGPLVSPPTAATIQANWPKVEGVVAAAEIALKTPAAEQATIAADEVKVTTEVNNLTAAVAPTTPAAVATDINLFVSGVSLGSNAQAWVALIKAAAQFLPSS